MTEGPWEHLRVVKVEWFGQFQLYEAAQSTMQRKGVGVREEEARVGVWTVRLGWPQSA